MWFDVKLCHCVFFTGTGKTALVRKPVKKVSDIQPPDHMTMKKGEKDHHHHHYQHHHHHQQQQQQ